MDKKISDDLDQLRQVADDVQRIGIIMSDVYPALRMIETNVRSLSPAFEIAGYDSKKLVSAIHAAWVEALDAAYTTICKSDAMKEDIKKAVTEACNDQVQDQ